MRVFVTGGTGLIGSKLVQRLSDRGDTVVLLTRRGGIARDRFPGCTVVEGDPVTPGPWMDAVADCDAVVNLAGANIFGKRWNDDYKRVLLDSRVKTTDNVVAALGRQPLTAAGAAKVLVNASAIGCYGPRGDEEIDEGAPPGDDVLAKICVAWEQSARAAEPLGVRVALVRIGVVLDRAGGALAAMLTPFRLGVGGRAGSGRQWLSWVHHADAVGILLLALDSDGARGPLNATAPNPVTNAEFTRALGRALHRPTIFPIPAFALKLRFGEVACVVLTGQRVLPRQPQKLGYAFQFPGIDEALADILK